MLGKASYSIYIWHQLLLAFIFYSVFQFRSFLSFIVFTIAIVLISIPSFCYVEKNLALANKSFSKRNTVIFISSLAAIIVCSLSLYIYFHAGIVRDVPELDIKKSNSERRMHAKYVDRPFQWNKNFDSSDKLKILVIGNSFGRDWANVLHEYDPNLDILYLNYDITLNISIVQRDHARVKDADYVFVATGPGYEMISEKILSCLPPNKLYIVGNKNYGESNGIIYSHRFSEDYFNQTVSIPPELIQSIARDKELFGSRYIDMMKPLMQEDGKVRVFTDDNKYISQDCRHLTHAGCQYYSKILNLDSLFASN